MEKLVQDETSWNEYREKYTKAFDPSYTYTLQLLEWAVLNNPAFVLLPGDVTLNGEKASHEMLAELLTEYKQRGVRSYILPGNHDIDMHKARQFITEGPYYAPTVSLEEFIALYEDFGYNEAYSKDPISASYAVEILPDTVLIALDTCQYHRHQLTPDRHTISKGGIRPATIEWPSITLSEAESSGKTIILSQHHPLSDESIPARSSVADSAALYELFDSYGVSLVINAHLHTYYVNFSRSVPQLIAPNISSGPQNGLLVVIKDGKALLTRNNIR